MTPAVPAPHFAAPGEPLRSWLRNPASHTHIQTAVAAGALARLLPVEVTPHILDVYARVERLAEPGPDAWILKLTALVHEEPPATLPTLLAATEFASQVPMILALVLHFGAVWQCADPSALATFVSRQHDRLDDLLLFEVAHEGGATRAMWEAARQARHATAHGGAPEYI